MAWSTRKCLLCRSRQVPVVLAVVVVPLLLSIQWRLFLRLHTLMHFFKIPSFWPAETFLRYKPTQKELLYPRWKEDGIDFEPLHRHITNQLLTPRTPHFPETLYVLKNRTELWVSRKLRTMHIGPLKQDRVVPVESLFQDALLYLDSKRSEENRWKPLQKAMERKEGIPFVMDYKDYRGCGGRLQHDLQHEDPNATMLPMFSLCATVEPSCEYAFPIPTYFIIRLARDSWEKVFREYELQQPWESKIRKAVWRGAFTGRSLQGGLTNQRRNMYRIGKNHTDVMDAEEATKMQNEFYMPMDDFRNYRAVLDLDGDAWSKRFGGLLCFNSVVIKVEPASVDYFHPSLWPWVHYIPVKEDLSDLVEQVAYAVSDEHEEEVKTIILNAQTFCGERFTKESLLRDMLDIWTSYVNLLERGDSTWYQQWRNTSQESDFSRAFDMARFELCGDVQHASDQEASHWTELHMERVSSG